MKYLKLFFCVVLSSILCVSGIFAISFYNEPLNSESVYVVNENTGLPIIEKNIHQKRSPASLTKIMTFIVAYENVQNIADTRVKVSQEVLDLVDPDSSGVHLKAGEEISVLDLMHCILICSSGYAANVLADYVGEGDIHSFVDKMNAKGYIPKTSTQQLLTCIKLLSMPEISQLSILSPRCVNIDVLAMSVTR